METLIKIEIKQNPIGYWYASYYDAPNHRHMYLHKDGTWKHYATDGGYFKTKEFLLETLKKVDSPVNLNVVKANTITEDEYDTRAIQTLTNYFNSSGYKNATTYLKQSIESNKRDEGLNIQPKIFIGVWGSVEEWTFFCEIIFEEVIKSNYLKSFRMSEKEFQFNSVLLAFETNVGNLAFLYSMKEFHGNFNLAVNMDRNMLIEIIGKNLQRDYE